MQEVTDVSMVEVCVEEGVSLEQAFFILLFFAVAFVVMRYSRFEDIYILLYEGNSL